jgi:hypothetical protein
MIRSLQAESDTPTSIRVGLRVKESKRETWEISSGASIAKIVSAIERQQRSILAASAKQFRVQTLVWFSVRRAN